MFRILKEDLEFRSLELPLSKAQYDELEHRILMSGKHDIIFVWKDTIIYGYACYDICQRYHYRVKPTDQYFSHRDNVIAWVCRRQLKHNDMNQNAKAWLLYRLYEAEKRNEKRRRAKEDFQYRQLSPSTHATSIPFWETGSMRVMSDLGKEFGICSGTLTRYVAFGKKLDQLEIQFPGVRNRILLGELEIARAHIGTLLEMPRDILQKMLNDPTCKRLSPYKVLPNEKEERKPRRKRQNVRIETGIKQMPTYDPDAELNGLTYTVGAWVKAVSRTKERTNFEEATNTGKERLRQALAGLIEEVDALENMLEVNINE